MNQPATPPQEPTRWSYRAFVDEMDSMLRQRFGNELVDRHTHSGHVSAVELFKEAPASAVGLFDDQRKAHMASLRLLWAIVFASGGSITLGPDLVFQAKGATWRLTLRSENDGSLQFEADDHG